MTKLDRIIDQTNQLRNLYKLYEFPEFITALREALDISRAKVSEETKIHPTTLFLYEKGKIPNVIQDKHILALAQYYGVDYEMLKAKSAKYQKSRERKVNS